jgi:serine phosphatase RsbU (regulator of sigma subunit)
MSPEQIAIPDRMQCMEVWGGNAPVDRAFDVTGLRVWVHSQPYQSAAGGGDVYYVSSCASGRITRLLLSDVSGHGEEVAKVAVGLRDLMRRNINLINQTRFVREMNRQFSAQPGRAGFATALICTFFAPTHSLQFCNAGHPTPLLYRMQKHTWASAQELASVKSADGLADTPLGVTDEADYSRFDTFLAPGDMVLCVSDAFTEARNETGQMLGSEGLLKLVQALDVTHPDRIIPQILAEIHRLHADTLQDDDATILLFQANGATTSIVDNLLAPFRLLSGVRDATGIR